MRKKLFVFIREFIQIFTSERILREAASLTFVTVLGFVPFTLFVLTFFPDIPSLNVLDHIKDLFATFLIPESADSILEMIDNLFHYQVSLNIFNITMLVITSFSLFNSITASFDRILKIEQKPLRRTFGTLLKVFGMVVLGFFIFTLLISTASLPYFQEVFTLNIVRAVFNFILPLIFWFLFINIAYLFLPNAKLQLKSILIAASISAVVWFGAKLGFDLYIHNLTRMKQIYGIISSFPIFLIWIYLNWIFILSGVIIMAILNGQYTKHKEFEMTAQISLTINRKVSRDYIKEIELGDEEENLLRKFLAEMLAKKEKKK